MYKNINRMPFQQGLIAFCLLLSLGLTALNATAGQILIPDIGAPADILLTTTEEERIGKEFMRRLRKQIKVIDDPQLTHYIQSLGNKLVQSTDTGTRNFHFFLVDAPSINAFAGPGGYIGVHTGLILTTKTESELASVLSHEIAHVTQNHLLRAFDNSKNMSGKTAAMLIASIILAATVSPDLGLAGVAGAQAHAVQDMINFTRSNEEEADRIGISILADAKFDPQAMPTFFARLGKATRSYDSKAPEFLRTHPVTSQRLADTRARARDYPYRQYTNSPEYEYTRVNLKAEQFTNAQEAVIYFRAALKEKNASDNSLQRYGYALALIKAGNHSTAQIELTTLLQQLPNNPAIILAQTKLQQLDNKTEQALQTIKKGLAANPDNQALQFKYSELLLFLEQPKQAKNTLLELLNTQSENPELYDMLARATGSLNQVAEAHRYRAERYYLRGELKAAIQQLELAVRKRSGSFYEAARSQARLDELKAEMEDNKDVR